MSSLLCIADDRGRWEKRRDGKMKSKVWSKTQKNYQCLNTSWLTGSRAQWGHPPWNASLNDWTTHNALRRCNVHPSHRAISCCQKPSTGKYRSLSLWTVKYTRARNSAEHVTFEGQYVTNNSIWPSVQGIHAVFSGQPILSRRNYLSHPVDRRQGLRFHSRFKRSRNWRTWNNPRFNLYHFRSIDLTRTSQTSGALLRMRGIKRWLNLQPNGSR